jgi:hypothetical protein
MQMVHGRIGAVRTYVLSEDAHVPPDQQATQATLPLLLRHYVLLCGSTQVVHMLLAAAGQSAKGVGIWCVRWHLPAGRLEVCPVQIVPWNCISQCVVHPARVCYDCKGFQEFGGPSQLRLL